MNLSKSTMFEAARLTREGRLAEATALIRRSLGLGGAPAGGRGHVVEPPVIEARSTEVSEAPPPEPRVAGTQASGQAPPVQPETHQTFKPGPAPPVAPIDPSSRADPMKILGRLSARRPSPRQFPAEVIFPSGGRWIAKAYTGQAGNRAYKLYLPSGDEGQSRSLVVMLHGCTQSADDFAAGTRINFLAEQEGLIVVYPEQAVAANSSRCWNWFQPADQRRGHGEPEVIAGITRQVMAEHRVQADRVYIAGLSAGGAMAAILAAEYPDLFAAVGVHSGLVPGSAHDLPSAFQAMQRGGRAAGSGLSGRAIPLILFQGDQDKTVHPSNAEEFIRLWAGASNAASEMLHRGEARGGRAYSCSRYQDPSGRTLIERWMIHGASHAWAGGSPNGTFTDPTGPDASGELLRFFRNIRAGRNSPHESLLPGSTA